jgi:RecA-family ATPase
VATSKRAGPKPRQRTKAKPKLPRPGAQDVRAEVKRILVREEARRVIDADRAGAIELPKLGHTLADALAERYEPPGYTVARLHRAEANTVLIAQYKAGKTTLCLNLVQALADGEPFLGKFEVQPLDGRVAYFNYELSEGQFREWADEIGIKNQDAVAAPLHLRGRSLPLWIPEVRLRVVRWLKANEVVFWIVDPAARAWQPLVDNENDNARVGAFTDALDQVKREAGIRDLLITAHTGRGRQENGQERSRGATRLEDWMDAGIYLTKERDTRALRAEGRDVSVEAIELEYDPTTRQVRTTGRTKSERHEDEGVLRAVEALAQLEGTDNYPAKTSALEHAMSGDQNRRNAWVRVAVDRGLIARAAGPRRAQLHSLTDAGRQLLPTPIKVPEAKGKGSSKRVRRSRQAKGAK